jgi:hypothetical protein
MPLAETASPDYDESKLVHSNDSSAGGSLWIITIPTWAIRGYALMPLVVNTRNPPEREYAWASAWTTRVLSLESRSLTIGHSC